MPKTVLPKGKLTLDLNPESVFNTPHGAIYQAPIIQRTEAAVPTKRALPAAAKRAIDEILRIRHYLKTKPRSPLSQEFGDLDDVAGGLRINRIVADTFKLPNFEANRLADNISRGRVTPDDIRSILAKPASGEGRYAMSEAQYMKLFGTDPKAYKTAESGWDYFARKRWEQMFKPAEKTKTASGSVRQPRKRTREVK